MISWTVAYSFALYMCKYTTIHFSRTVFFLLSLHFPAAPVNLIHRGAVFALSHGTWQKIAKMTFTPTQVAMWKMIHTSKQAHLHVASVATLISITGLRKTNLRDRGVYMNLLYVISEFCFLLLVMYQVNLSIF